ncbi:MAG: serine/threonine protein kinase, partial [Actinomycetia bacterium]|nr:serine/threonine protein kinase [Actinomycetes bacterium]
MTSWGPSDGMPGAAASPGVRLGDRYELAAPIAAGGMAQVWSANDLVLNREVAVKILHPHLATDEAFVARFRREAVAAARLTHRSIVAVFDTISEPPLEAIVMELIDGRTLRMVLDDVGALPARDVIQLGVQISAALEVAHQAGIVHRDIKPANIMVSNDRRIMVTDFGIAKAGTDADLTTTGTLLGTAKYLSPEQVTGAPIDPRSDLYSLGVVLFEALTGTVPFKANTDAATALARLHQDPPLARQMRPNVPLPWEAILARLMARELRDRVPRAGDVGQALLSVDPDAPPGPAITPSPAAAPSPRPAVTGLAPSDPSHPSNPGYPSTPGYP